MNSNTIILQVGVKVLLNNRDGKYLLVRRSRKKYPEIGFTTWDIVGGRITPGTPLLENLKREVKEETGLELIGEPKLIGAQDILRVPGRHIVRLTYLGEARGNVVLDTEENDAYEWVTRKELENHGELDIYVHELVEQGNFFK